MHRTTNWVLLPSLVMEVAAFTISAMGLMDRSSRTSTSSSVSRPPTSQRYAANLIKSRSTTQRPFSPTLHLQYTQSIHQSLLLVFMSSNSHKEHLQLLFMSHLRRSPILRVVVLLLALTLLQLQFSQAETGLPPLLGNALNP